MPVESNALEANKEVVRRFNLRVIQEGDRAAFEELIDEEFVNRSAPAGAANGREAMWHTFESILWPALSRLRVTIQDQVAEGDKVTTRKTITGVHEGPLAGVAPTGREIAIEVIDIVRLKDGRYFEHWGINTMSSVVASLKQA